MLKTFWKSKIGFTFILNSGKEIKFKADDVIIQRLGNDLVGYEIKNCDNAPFYCRLDNIVAILKDK